MEGRRHSVGDPVYGYLPFFHAFQQGGLNLGCSPVDFIGKDNLRHYRSGAEFKITALLVIDGHPGYVAGKHIRCKLDSLEGAVQ